MTEEQKQLRKNFYLPEWMWNELETLAVNSGKSVSETLRRVAEIGLSDVSEKQWRYVDVVVPMRFSLTLPMTSDEHLKKQIAEDLEEFFGDIKCEAQDYLDNFFGEEEGDCEFYHKQLRFLSTLSVHHSDVVFESNKDLSKQALLEHIVNDADITVSCRLPADKEDTKKIYQQLLKSEYPFLTKDLMEELIPLIEEHFAEKRNNHD